MGKLNLLIPDYTVNYTNFGKGEKVKYLEISDSINKKALEQDIKEGAIQFKECLDMYEKGLSRVVMISCSNEEDGYMAVSYLAAMENNRLGIKRKTYGYGEKPDYTMSDEQEKLTYEDIRDNEMEGIDSVDDDDGEVYEEDEFSYCESPFRVPVLGLSDLVGDIPRPVLFDGPMNMASSNMENPKKPYWHSCVEEPVCILMKQTDRFGAFDHINRVMDRFRCNRNVYIIMQDILLDHPDIDNGNPFIEHLSDDTVICTFVLEHTADFIIAHAKEEDLEKYRINQFDDWISDYGVRLEKNFPKKTMIKRILDINRPSKSELMSLVLKYVIKNKNSKENVLTKDDFKLLSKFKSIGIIDNESERMKSSQRLEKELVGMEGVKQQVREIVDLMNYNRNREEMGFGKSNYHNVHLLIGAPGTAKTTVAKLMGEMMCEQKLITGNRFVSVNGADLKGMYVGHSAPKTKALFQDYDIILIDEAYSLMTEGKGSDSFSQEAMAQLIIEIEEHAMDKLVFFAGYGGLDVSEKDNRMKQFIDGNPGLKSRINSTIYFKSYTPDEMVAILHCQAKTFKFKIDHKADSLVREHYANRVKDSNFGNGREARSLLENATLFAATRVMKLPEHKRTKKAYETITYDDIKSAIERMEGSNILQTGRKDRVCGFVY
ncbi:MAG: AAA family ATPase [Lachnospiraceae bacterium]|nr:AAA family ATPase [Lachnospiraceae bacterium]